MKETIKIEFNESYKAYNKNHEYNEMYISTCIQYMHHILTSRGYLFLRDAYEFLGVPVTRNILGKGWAINDLKGTDDFMALLYDMNRKFMMLYFIT